METRKKKASYRYCLGGCGKRIDPDTGQCPTPEACATLRKPHQRAAQATRATEQRVRTAERESAEVVYVRQTPEYLRRAG